MKLITQGSSVTVRVRLKDGQKWIDFERVENLSVTLFNSKRIYRARRYAYAAVRQAPHRTHREISCVVVVRPKRAHARVRSVLVRRRSLFCAFDLYRRARHRESGDRVRGRLRARLRQRKRPDIPELTRRSN